MSVIDERDRFAELAAEVIEPLRRYLARRTDPATADDVVSETLLVCWRRVGEIPRDAPVAWTIGVARLCLSNAQRSHRRRHRLVHRITTVDPPPQSWDDVGEGIADTGPATRVAVAMARLPDADAEVLRLWAWEELSAGEIGTVLGITANAAGVRLHRGKKKLRLELDDTTPTS